MHLVAANTWEPWMRAGDRMLLDKHTEWARALERIRKALAAELKCFYGQRA